MQSTLKLEKQSLVIQSDSKAPIVELKCAHSCSMTVERKSLDVAFPLEDVARVVDGFGTGEYGDEATKT